MKGVLVEAPGGPEALVLRDVPDPSPGPGEVSIEIRAAALNRADLLQRRGLYPPPRGASPILGLECAGVVSALGPGTSTLRVGERVMALLAGGGYAEQVAVPEALCMRIPERLSFVDAAAIPEAFLTAREALFTLGRVTPGLTVLVHAAAGGIGTAAVQLARHAGARVIATASAAKHDRLTSLGADVLVDYQHEDFADVVLRETEQRGADVVLDFVGGSYWAQHTRCLATAGRLVSVGVLGGAAASVNLGQLLQRRWQLLGLVMRSRSVSDKVAITRAFVRESLPALAEGRLRPVVDRTFALEDVAEAHRVMEKNENFGKLVLQIAEKNAVPAGS